MWELQLQGGALLRNPSVGPDCAQFLGNACVPEQLTSAGLVQLEARVYANVCLSAERLHCILWHAYQRVNSLRPKG